MRAASVALLFVTLAIFNTIYVSTTDLCVVICPERSDVKCYSLDGKNATFPSCVAGNMARSDPNSNMTLLHNGPCQHTSPGCETACYDSRKKKTSVLAKYGTQITWENNACTHLNRANCDEAARGYSTANPYAEIIGVQKVCNSSK